MSSPTTLEFSQPYKMCKTLSPIRSQLEDGGWFQLGGKSCYSIPLKVESSSGLNRSLVRITLSVRDLEERAYALSITMSESNHLSIELGSKDSPYRFEPEAERFVTVQRLTEMEAQKVYEAAKNSFNLQAEIWHV